LLLARKEQTTAEGECGVLPFDQLRVRMTGLKLTRIKIGEERALIFL
jgi:hypothetical protein